jgi:hypothetical protein
MKENTDQWMELARLIAAEQDPKKLLALVEELNAMLDKKRYRLERQTQASSD